MTRSDRSKSRSGDDGGAARALALGATAAVAAAGFGVLAAAVARRDTARADHAVKKRTAPRRGHPARKAAKALKPAGKWWTYIPGALASAGLYARSATRDMSLNR